MPQPPLLSRRGIRRVLDFMGKAHKGQMRIPLITIISAALFLPAPAQQDRGATAALVLRSNSLKPSGQLTLDGLFYEAVAGRVTLPPVLTSGVRTIDGGRWSGEARVPDG